VEKSSVFEWHKQFKEMQVLRLLWLWCFKSKKPQLERSKDSYMLKSKMKTVLITFFDIKGTVHFEFIPQGQRVNKAYYVEIL
jgi:hypothetical protein